MRLYRCRICGDPYLGLAVPSNCPFCGAHEKYMVVGEEWCEPVTPEISEMSRKNIKKAIDLEVDNSKFYRDISDATGDLMGKGLFKALSKIEAEHASTFLKFVDLPKPQPPEREISASYEENLEEAHRREKRAVKFYTQAAAYAVEERVKEVFLALVEIESDHIELSRTGEE